MANKAKRAFLAHSAHDLHHDGHKLDKGKGNQMGADALEKLKSGEFVLTHVSPEPKGGQPKDAYLAETLAKFESGAYIQTGVQSSDFAVEGHPPEQGVTITYHKQGSTEPRTIEVRWKLAD